jgi:8-oxo-dGTP pyrophosphatase MutT (NUDIX family)
MQNPWKKLSTKVIYENPWIKVVEDKVIHPNQKEGVYGYINVRPMVFVIAKDTDDKVFLIKEYKYVIESEIWNLPGGFVKKDKDDLQSANEELAEELGFEAKTIKKLGEFVFAPSHETTVGSVFLATDLTKISEKLGEGDESISKFEKFSEEDIKTMIGNGSINTGYVISSFAKYFFRNNLE